MVRLILIPVLMMCPGITFAELAAGKVQPGPTLSVNGRGEVFVEPDQAVVQIGVRENAPTAVEAQASVNKTVHQVLGALADLSIDPQRIRTSQLSLQAISSDSRGRREIGERHIIGYDAIYTLSITVLDLDLVSAVIDSALGAGANHLRGVRFELRDESPARQEGLRRAVADAMTKGEVVAQAAGTEIVRVLEIVEGGAVVTPPMLTRTAMTAEASAMPTPVLPGQVTVFGQVTIRYLLEDRD